MGGAPRWLLTLGLIVGAAPASADGLCERLLAGGVRDRAQIFSLDQRQEEAKRFVCSNSRLTEEEASSGSGQIEVDVIDIFTGSANGNTSGSTFKEQVKTFCEAGSSALRTDRQLASLVENVSSVLVDAYVKCVDIIAGEKKGVPQVFVETLSPTNFAIKIRFDPLLPNIKSYTIQAIDGLPDVDTRCVGDPLGSPLDKPLVTLNCTKGAEEDLYLSVRTDLRSSDLVKVPGRKVDPAVLQARLDALSTELAQFKDRYDERLTLAETRSDWWARTYVRQGTFHVPVSGSYLVQTLYCDPRAGVAGARDLALAGGFNMSAHHKAFTSQSNPDRTGWEFRIVDQVHNPNANTGINLYVICVK